MFTNPIAGFIPNSEFVYSTTTVNADDVNCTNLTATNANITNLVTTTFTPTNINGVNLSVVTATIDTANIDTANIHTANIVGAVIDVSYVSVSNTNTLVCATGNINNILTNEIKLNDKDGINVDDALIYRDANEVVFIGKTDPTGIGVDYLFYPNQKLGTPRFIIHRDTNFCEAQNMTITSRLTSEIIETDILEFVDNTLANRKSYVQLVNGQLKFIAGTGINTDILFYNKLTDGPILTIYNLGIQVPGTVDATTLLGDIYDNLQAGTGIGLTRSSGKTIITNTAQVSDPLTINTLNSKTINNEFTITTNKTATKYIDIIDTDNGNISTFSKTTNILNFFGTYVSTPIDINFFTKLFTSNQPILQLLGNDNKVVVNSLLETQHIECTSLHSTGQVLTATLSSDIINSYYEMYINDRNGTSAKTQIHRTTDYFEMYNPITSGSYKFYTALNTGIPQLEITSSGIIADISANLQAGIGISLSSSNGITTITNTGIVTDPLTINTLNSTTINNSGTIDSTILKSDELLINDTIQTAASARFFMESLIFKICAQSTTSISQADISFYSNKGTGTPKLRINRGDNVVDIIKLRVSQDIESDILLINDTITSNIINAATINSTTINNSGTINSSFFQGDISQNLIGGSGIALSTTSGVTTIESTGGLSTSTQYAFQVTSNLNNNQSIVTGSTAIFNAIEICVPSVSAYNTAGYYYTCPVAGLYKFGLKAFINSDVDNFRLAIFKNGGILMAMGGAGSEASEAFETINLMAAGETVYIGCVTGQAYVYMAPKHSWWYGHLLQPENNTVGITTDLTVATLNADLVGATEMVSTLITSGFMNTGILTATTVNGDISNNLDSGNNINLVTVAGVTTINAQIPSSYTNLTINNLTSTAITTNTLTATTVTGDISNNLSAGTDITLNTVAGVTTINAQIPSSYTDLTINNLTSTSITTEDINTSNASINNATITTADIINLSNPLVGASRYYSRRQTTSQTPGDTNQNYYSNYNLLVADNPHVTWATPNNATGGANTGFIIQTAGIYRIEYTFVAHSVSYNNRIGWFTRLYKNGVTFDADQYETFIYTRGDQTSFAQWGSANTFCIVTLAVGDYIHTRTNVAKNSPIHNNDWTGIEAGWGGTCSFEYLGT